MTTKYNLHKNGNFGSLTKTVEAGTLDNRVTVKIEVCHTKGVDYPPLVQVIIHRWVDWEDTHAFLEFATIKEGWDAFTQLCKVLGVMA